ncbi:MAG: glycosyltransferase family A protein [Phycisphaeraceae bacterium]
MIRLMNDPSPVVDTRQMQDGPLVSVLIPVYNAAGFLRETLESALSQSYRNLEVIVNDDGSTDDSPAIIAAFGNRLRTTVTRRAGIAGARNAMLKVAHGKYVALLDHDDLFLPEKTAMQVAIMEANPQVAVCHTATECFDAWTGDGPIPDERRRRIDGACFDKLLQSNGIVPCSAMIRRSALPPDGFDEAIFGVDDYKLFLRILFRHEAHYVKALTARYRRHESQTSGSQGRNLQLFGCRAKLEVLDEFKDEIPADQLKTWRGEALEQLEHFTLSHYWRKEWTFARAGFEALRNHGGAVPLRRRLRAWVGQALAGKQRVK